MRKYWPLLVSIILLAGPCLAQYPRPETDVDVGFIRAGVEPWWPIFMTHKDGRLMMIGNNQKRYSSDGGRSWSKRQTFIPDDKRVGGLKGIVRMKDGRLGGVFNEMGGIPNEAGRDKQNFYWQNFYFRSSDDEGETWSKPVLINKGNMIGMPHVDTLLQLKSGRLLIPVRRGFIVNSEIHKASGRRGIIAGTERKLGGHMHYPEMDITFCYLSDDNGKSWYKSDGYIFGWRDKGYGGLWPCDEPVAVELKDGRVMLFMRSTIGRLLTSVSEDGGYRWSIPKPSPLVSAYAPCMVRRIPDTGDLLCVWNQPSPEEMKRGFERTRLSCAISKDDGETWTHFKTIASVVVPPVGRIEAPVGHFRPPDWLGKMPDTYGNLDYPNITFADGHVLITYDFNPHHPPAAIWTIRGLPVDWFYKDTTGLHR